MIVERIMKLAATRNVGEMIVEVICIMNASSARTLYDDQRRPAQPTTSPMPQSTAVQSMNHLRYQTACPMWSTRRSNERMISEKSEKKYYKLKCRKVRQKYMSRSAWECIHMTNPRPNWNLELQWMLHSRQRAKDDEGKQPYVNLTRRDLKGETANGKNELTNVQYQGC
jgi:hypothetical protein